LPVKTKTVFKDPSSRTRGRRVFCFGTHPPIQRWLNKGRSKMAEEPAVEAKDFDQLFDEKAGELEKGTPAEPSTEIKPEGTETKPDGSTAEVEKTEQVKEVESDASLSVEDKIAKVKEILGDDEKAIDAYVKEKGYHNDPAWQKREELIKRLKEEGEAKVAMSEADRTALDDFKVYRNSADYIQNTMESKGYTQEAIDAKLKESGFDVETKPQDDLQLVLDKTGSDRTAMTKGELDQVNDMIRIANILIEDRLGKGLSKELAPMKEHMQSNEQKAAGESLWKFMESTVKDEDILDFKKDIEPLIGKFLDENPDALQDDIRAHFNSIYHPMTIERLKTGKRQEVRDEKKSSIRQNTPAGGGNKLPNKTGNFEDDSEAFFAVNPV